MASVHHPAVYLNIFTSPPRRPVAENFAALAAHSCPLFCGSTSMICRNFGGLKLWMHRNLKYQGSKIKQKHERKTEFKMQQIDDKDQLPVPSDTYYPRQDIQHFSASVVPNETSSSSNTQHEKNSIINQSGKSKRASASLKSFPDAHKFLSIVVIGATGELARLKIFPALFSLYYSGFLPENVGIFGYSRKNLTDDDLRSMIASTLTCRIDQQQNCDEKMEAFLKRTYHFNGGYDNREGMLKLSTCMEQVEGDTKANRMFYLSVPEEALLDVASSLANSAQSKNGWNRIIIEKPFGFDLQSSNQLTYSLMKNFSENQIYRIDHLLGRNTIENLAVLRFSNLVFMPLWNRNYIRNIQVVVSEDLGLKTGDRYLNSHGIIGDVVHSHIFQTIALLAMEPPVTLEGEDVRNEKVKLLRSIRKLETSNVILGYCMPASGAKGGPELGRKAPTYFATAMFIDNARWDGVPFMIKVGRGLTNHRIEIRIQFRHVPGNLYGEHISQRSDLINNELILRDVPEEAILVRVNNKIPGLGIHLDASELNLLYKDKYNIEVPDSYEQLLHDVIDGDNHLFMRSDEVAAAWNLLSPVLREMDSNNLVPEKYEQGSRGPDKAIYLWAKHGVKWMDD
ncbi:inactive glucose-6-phosphate 1-dehydrogenase 4, chloroplastic isoform X2 [Andrographis paniculata]|uniref:inactive glucose-6-phosphate 1-dehydrogenase 4, chloroplastic isoform X2 n=1 Tax=Andrographis paniculata TaxID=175694 RepID=UPI0021E7B4F3|nr:inactive glucose-6-phosphate 1-dehydrogenase 4, chloroplastic isoform X2 [Andrographis paniculata]